MVVDKTFKKNAVVKIILLMILASIVFSAFVLLSRDNESVKFDLERWLNNPEERYKLADSLVESEILTDLSREEVKELLGEFKVFNLTPNDMYYDLNCIEILDTMYLEIIFKEDKVIEATFFRNKQSQEDRIIEFDRELWLNSPDDRYKMIDDLIDSELLIGMSFEEVIDFLGENSTADPSNNCITYNLGKFMFSTKFLMIGIENDKVIYVDWYSD